MISRTHATIFVHQRKAAGSSVKALFPEADNAELNDGILDPAWTAFTSAHDYFSFTVIRNPYDRFISGWRYCETTRDRDLIDVLTNLPRENLLLSVLSPGISWRTRGIYAAAYRKRLRRRIRKRGLLDTLSLRAAPHDAGHDYRHLTRPQWKTVVGPDGELAVDAVLFLERLEAGLGDIADEIGVQGRDLKTLNAQKSRTDYREAFCSESRRLFEKRFERELDIWRYDFASGQPMTQKTHIRDLDDLR
ncbi:MAG: sulfotransferase family 2 domain-containing protein [Pseudomonadota bacterium]